MSMLHEITGRVPRHKRGLRKGRGEGSGRGKTAGRGTKGSGARAGKPINPGHEGGQTRIYRRLPTRGFSNSDFERNWYIVNVGQLNRFEDGQPVDASALIQAGLVPDGKLPVKILGDGELGRRLTVMAGWYSRSAHQKIISAGGAAQSAKGEPFEFPKPKRRPGAPRPQEKGGAAGAAAPAAATEAGAAGPPATAGGGEAAAETK